MKIDLEEIKVLHYQYTDWERMASKHRWYQCWELLNQPERSAFEIYCQYHHMYEVKESNVLPVKDIWTRYYLERDIDINNINKEGVYWWDREVLRYFKEYGTRKFKKLDIWDADWQRVVEHFKIEGVAPIVDPRSMLDRLIHAWLKSGKYKKPGLFNLIVRKVLRVLRW